MNKFVILVKTLIMDSVKYHNLKASFKMLTSKDAEDNLAAFFGYVNTLNLIDIRDRMEDLRKKLENIEKNLNKL